MNTSSIATVSFALLPIFLLRCCQNVWRHSRRDFGASVLREPPEGTFNAARRKALMLRFARTSAARLHKYIDPEWICG